MQSGPHTWGKSLALRPRLPADNAHTKPQYFQEISLFSNAARAAVSISGEWCQYDVYFGESKVQTEQEIPEDDIINRRKIILSDQFLLPQMRETFGHGFEFDNTRLYTRQNAGREIRLYYDANRLREDASDTQSVFSHSSNDSHNRDRDRDRRNRDRDRDKENDRNDDNQSNASGSSRGSGSGNSRSSSKDGRRTVLFRLNKRRLDLRTPQGVEQLTKEFIIQKSHISLKNDMHDRGYGQLMRAFYIPTDVDVYSKIPWRNRDLQNSRLLGIPGYQAAFEFFPKIGNALFIRCRTRLLQYVTVSEIMDRLFDECGGNEHEWQQLCRDELEGRYFVTLYGTRSIFSVTEIKFGMRIDDTFDHNRRGTISYRDYFWVEYKTEIKWNRGMIEYTSMRGRKRMKQGKGKKFHFPADCIMPTGYPRRFRNNPAITNEIAKESAIPLRTRIDRTINLLRNLNNNRQVAHGGNDENYHRNGRMSASLTYDEKLIELKGKILPESNIVINTLNNYNNECIVLAMEDSQLQRRINGSVPWPDDSPLNIQDLGIDERRVVTSGARTVVLLNWGLLYFQISDSSNYENGRPRVIYDDRQRADNLKIAWRRMIGEQFGNNPSINVHMNEDPIDMCFDWDIGNANNNRNNGDIFNYQSFKAFNEQLKEYMRRQAVNVNGITIILPQFRNICPRHQVERYRSEIYKTIKICSNVEVGILTQCIKSDSIFLVYRNFPREERSRDSREQKRQIQSMQGTFKQFMVKMGYIPWKVYWKSPYWCECQREKAKFNLRNNKNDNNNDHDRHRSSHNSADTDDTDRYTVNSRATSTATSTATSAMATLNHEMNTIGYDESERAVAHFHEMAQLEAKERERERRNVGGSSSSSSSSNTNNSGRDDEKTAQLPTTFNGRRAPPPFVNDYEREEKNRDRDGDRNVLTAAQLNSWEARLNSPIHNYLPDNVINLLVPTMIVGIDVCHDMKAHHSTIGFVSTFDPDFVRIHTQISYQKRGKEVTSIKAMETLMTHALRNFHNINKVPPKQIFVFRDGVSTSQLETVCRSELQAIAQACQKFGPHCDRKYTNPENIQPDTNYPDLESINVYAPDLEFIVIQKRVNARFFHSRGREIESAPPRTVIDETMISGHFWDFYLIATRTPRDKCANPVRCIVIHDGLNLAGTNQRQSLQKYKDNQQKSGQNDLELFTYSLCCLYYNWPGAVRVPHVVKYADRSASAYSLFSDSAVPKDRIESALHFL